MDTRLLVWRVVSSSEKEDIGKLWGSFCTLRCLDCNIQCVQCMSESSRFKASTILSSCWSSTNIEILWIYVQPSITNPSYDALMSSLKVMKINRCNSWSLSCLLRSSGMPLGIARSVDSIPVLNQFSVYSFINSTRRNVSPWVPVLTNVTPAEQKSTMTTWQFRTYSWYDLYISVFHILLNMRSPSMLVYAWNGMTSASVDCYPMRFRRIWRGHVKNPVLFTWHCGRPITTGTQPFCITAIHFML